VRSIASSAARQYRQSPGFRSPEFSARDILPLDVYAVEFNEDLSAFHGPTLAAQRSYALDAIRYITSLYPADTKILILGHSMGGVVATSLLPSTNISAIITMATPHTLPPARFDRRIEEIFWHNQAHLKNDPTPIVSLCGGAADLMIPSESCVLPVPSTDVYRSTLFTSALEGSWTGVGHQEMVWCHQVRWQVARAALELSAASDVQTRSATLNKWLKDGHLRSHGSLSKLQTISDSVGFSQKIELHQNLILPSPKYAGSRTFYMPYLGHRKLILYVSQGTIRSRSPHHSIPLEVEAFTCRGAEPSLSCKILDSSSLRLLPSSQLNQKFPIPRAGTDEGDGIVLFEAELPTYPAGESWVAVKVDGADGRGWLSGGFIDPDDVNVVEIKTTGECTALIFWNLLI
jgi:glycosylphosphatidylinositol deacylase